MRLVRRLLVFGAAVATVSLLMTWPRAQETGSARNVLLFIGDGLGDSEITIARNYEVGAAGRLAMDSLPFSGEYTTYAVKENAPEIPDYVTDSAASGTG